MIEDHKNNSDSNYQIGLFALYNFLGVSTMSYFAFRGFKNASQKIKIDRPVGQRLNMKNMTSFRGLKQAIISFGLYFVGYGVLVYNLNLGDKLFQSCIKKDDEYTAKIKLDPLFQNFHIINTMKYFGISQNLIKKTEQQLRNNIQKNKDIAQKQAKFDFGLSFQRAFIKISQYMRTDKK